ncbi:uncharacterized protein LOC134838242 [Culicoides brevitarsis]|uniref:uncharacterized protein LOC134838242 n=1 Tax=Culicoides brevitarsis TaxID=469753 RepID=UPI00307BC57E
MRRQFNNGPSFFGNGFRSRFPPEFDDPFAKRSYESSFYGGDRDNFREENYSPYPNRGDDYNRYDYPDKFSSCKPSGMNVDTFLQMGKTSNSNWNSNPFQRRTYGNTDNSNLSQKDEVMPESQIQNTKYGNNFTSFDEELETSAKKPEIVPPPDEPKEKFKVLEVKCKVCNITLTSKCVYEVHIRGKKHLRREADAKKYSCELCCTQLFTMEEQQAHNETEQHQESVKVAEFFQKQRNEDPDVQKYKSKVAKQSGIMTQAEIDALKVVPNEHKYRCDLCNVNCNSPQMLQLHLSSKKHVKRSNDAKLNSKSNAVEYSCDVCQFLCYSAEEHERHSNSDEHSKALADKYKAGTIQTPAVPKEVEAALIPRDELDIVPERGADNVLWYNCAVCDVKTNSLDNHKMHINSKKHKSKVQGVPFVNKKAKYSSEALRNSYTRFVSGGGLGKKITGDPSAYCAKCEIQFKTPTELEEHFLTPAHKNHNPYKKKLFFDNESVAKKAKTSNGTPAIAGKISTLTSVTNVTKPATTTPLPTSDYGYGGGFDYTNPSYYQSTGQHSSLTAYQPSSAAYQATYQNPGAYGYSSYYDQTSYPATTTNQAAYSTPNATSWSYSTPYYQH